MGKKKHQMSYTRIYKTWMGIKGRCLYEKDSQYMHYGGRGIKICDEWLHSFDAFYQWAKNSGYNDSLTIDRINANGNYEPSNCRWVDRKTQANNRTNNNVITYHNESHTLSEWAEILDMNYSTLSARLNKYKWPVELAFSTESLPRGWNLRNGKARSIYSERNSFSAF